MATRNISLFANYHTGENCVTNYCGLMMKLVYESSPRKFEKLLSCMFPTCNLPVNPVFTQQEKQEKSVPDLIIRQQSFAIYFENKLTDWFHNDQLLNHIDGLLKEKADHTLLVLLCVEFNKHKENLENLQRQLAPQHIQLCMITYRTFCDCLREVCTDEFLKNTLDAFEEYLSRDIFMDDQKQRTALLQDWMTRLDVVNCGVYYPELDLGFYICPSGNDNPAYSHRRARIFGAYNDKQVSLLFNIKAVVTVPQNVNNKSHAIIQWKNDPTAQDEQIKKDAVNIIKTHRSQEHQIHDLQVFLLDNKQNTSFRKDTAGGMYASKQYFTIDSAITIEELAQLLNGKTWNEYNNKTIK